MLCLSMSRRRQSLRREFRYLHIEGAFYCGIGCLFLLYGLYRALGRPGMSVVLTVISWEPASCSPISCLPYRRSVSFGIWWSVPIGWFSGRGRIGLYPVQFILSAADRKELYVLQIFFKRLLHRPCFCFPCCLDQFIPEHGSRGGETSAMRQL